ncbi:sensor histidine kinase [Bradyrhizobium sp. HKCCYLS1011]|uniref:sensor histidine kinase n=1 Tax=Bradyrhizobium sp. HKCCYLS1011 TaxID=3420733 RepID=UPI003EC013BA
MRSWLFLTILFLAVDIFSSAGAAAAPKRVLLLHSFGPQFVPWVFIAAEFREQLFKRSQDKIDLYEASLEGSRFLQPEQEGPTVDYLVNLFKRRKLDLIVTVGAPAAFFVQKYREEFFPSTPLVIGGPEQRAIKPETLTAKDAPVVVSLNFQEWIENILQVLPDTTHIAWVVGASPLERFWTEEFRRVSERFADRLSFEWFNDLRFEDMLQRVSELPPHSAIFFVDLRVDAAGVPLDRDSVIPRLRAATNAPIFSYVENYLGQGIVGGPLMSTSELGRRMAEASVRILQGELPGSLNIPPVTLALPQYDWRELQHWNISEDRLPRGSRVLFREPTVWQQYSSQLASMFALLLVQGGLIFGLLFERRRRVQAEVQARKRSAELAHINRFSMAGELTATIAHEVNQPLAAILANVETAELAIKSPQPDLREISEILTDIHNDDVRASEVIRRIRVLLRKAPFQLKPLDLNEVARDAMRFLSALAVAREVNLTSYLPTPLPVSGDEIQLQQVILNLVVNAMDAMSEMPSAERNITVTTAHVGSSARLSVSDRGPGIAVEHVHEIFEPFFSTKREGMGMGLSIARTIVEAHGGKLWAENKAPRGAIFYVELPLASK